MQLYRVVKCVYLNPGNNPTNVGLNVGINEKLNSTEQKVRRKDCEL